MAIANATDARGPTAADLMTPSPRTCSPFSTVTEAAMIFRDENCGAVPVLDEGKPVGILTDRDVALAAASDPGVLTRPVSEIMARDLRSVRADTSVAELKTQFADAKVRRLLVTDDEGLLKGIVSWADLVARLPEREVVQVVADVIDVAQDPAASPVAPSAATADTAAPIIAPGSSVWTNPRALWALLREAGSDWMADRAPRLGAALAYYTAFSLAPLLLIAIAVAGLVFGREAAQGQIIDQLRGMLGPQGAEAVEAMLVSASEPGAGYTATAIGVILLLIGATGLFGQLQDAMNTVWEVAPKPDRGWIGLVKDRLLSFGMVMGTTFLLLVSLVVSALLASLSGLFGQWAAGTVGQAVNFVVSFAVITGLFGMIFRYLPDADVAWSDVWPGAAITAFLFALGKLGIGLYIGHSGVASAYGAAGSLVVVLLWASYSAQIFLYGAELTQVYANHYGSRIKPAENAMRTSDADRARQGMTPRTDSASA